MDLPDDLPDLSPDEERWLNQMVEYHQNLADGTLTASDTQPRLENHPDVDDRLARGKHLLDLLATIGEQRDDEEIGQLGPNGETTAAPEADSAVDFATWQQERPAAQRLGRFTIVQELGIGGHGVVLLAFDTVLKRHVALKIPRSETMMSAALRRRFLREARAAARLTHPNLVSVYEVGEAGRIGYIAAAYCAGPSLAQWLSEQQAPPAPRQVARLIAQLADAMQYAHSQGVLHRDIKPSNVLLDPEGISTPAAVSAEEFPFVPKLTDFGLARLEGSPGTDTLSGVAIGTPGYMAPEQVEGRVADIGPATDVYGLGAIMYEVLTLQRPFVGTSDADCMQRILHEDPLPPSRWRSDIDRDIESICLKCLEKQPGRRYASPQALASDLRRFLAGEPIKARRVTRVERLARWARRNPRVALLSAAVLALLTTLAVGSTVAAVRLDRASVRERAATAAAQREARRAAGFAAQAQSESETALGVARFLEGMFRSADPIGLEGVRFHAGIDWAAELTAAEILRQGAETLETELRDQPAVQAKLMAVIGSVYVTLGRLHEAEPLLERSLAMREELCGPDSLETAESLHDLASLRFANFDFSDTRQLLERARAIRVQQLGPQHPDTIRTKFNLAWLVITNGHSTTAQKEAALPLMEEVLQFHRRENASPTRYGFALIGLAMLRYELQDKPFHAASLVAEASRVLSQNGDSDVGAGLLLMLRSYVQRRIGSPRAAVGSIEGAIARLRKAAGDRHPILIWPHYMWAEALTSGGQYDEALRVYSSAVDLCREIYDDRHRAVGISQAHMWEPLVLKEDWAQAEVVLREALDIFRQESTNLSNRDHCLQDLVDLLQTRERTAEAALVCQQELALARALPVNRESASYLQAILRTTARAEEALRHWDAASALLGELSDREAAEFGAADSRLAGTLIDRARVALAAGAQDEYRATCHRLLHDFAPHVSPLEQRELLWICALGATDSGISANLVRLASAGVNAQPRHQAWQRTMALAYLRGGQVDQALEVLHPMLARPRANLTWADYALLALAHHRRGDTAAARSWLDKAELAPVPEIATNGPIKRMPYRERLERDLLLVEIGQALAQLEEVE